MKLKIAVLCFVSVLTINTHAGWLENALLPKLTKEQTEWTLFQRGANKTNDDDPFIITSDGYKLVETYNEPEFKDSNGNVRRHAYVAVTWGWSFTVTNVSDKNYSISVTYKLQDADGFELADGYGQEWIAPGTSVTLKGTGKMKYSDVKRLSGSTWSFSKHKAAST